jgi:hypothetical protein
MKDLFFLIDNAYLVNLFFFFEIFGEKFFQRMKFIFGDIPDNRNIHRKIFMHYSIHDSLYFLPGNILEFFL